MNLSGGQIQRIAIARALLKKTIILILDDCFSSVDSKTEKDILSNIKEIKKNETVIIVSNKIKSVMHADLILVLDKGVLVEKGSHEKLISTNGFYKKLTKKQLEKSEHIEI